MGREFRARSNLRRRLLASLIVALVLCPAADLGAESYTYDQAGRLIQVVYDDGSVITYTYDANGNLLERVIGTLPEDIFADGFE